VPTGLLSCWALFKDCMDVSCMCELFKLGVLFRCKSLLQIWSIGWKVLRRRWVGGPQHAQQQTGQMNILGLPPLFLEMSVCRPTIVPRYLHLNLSKHVMHNVSRLPLRVLWKLRQQRGLMMVLAYVTNVLLMMNIIRTRCMLFYFAKTNELWAEETFFFSVNAFFWGFFSSPSLFAATSQQPTFIITFLSRTLDSFQRWSSEAPNKGTLGKWLEYLRRNWLISSLGAMS